MLRKLHILAGLVLLGLTGSAQTQEGFLDVFVAKVKPEKRAEFDAVAKKMADLNRRNKGDTWTASEIFYGEGNTVYFVSGRQSYGEIQKGFDAFLAALGKPGGPVAAAKIFQDFNNCLVSSRSEVRRRRMDLSSNAPVDTAALNKLVGQSRFVRTVMVRVRPGRTLEYEDQIRQIKAAAERTPGMPTLVSQAAAGQQGAVYYLSTFRSSMGGFDGSPTLQQLLGDRTYRDFLKASAENTFGNEIIITRFMPELSNPPEEIASVAPDFWRPKPAAAPKPKPKAAAGKTSE